MLVIHSNSLLGPIPDSIGNLSSLQVLHAWKNFLEGSIPYSFGRLTSLIGLGFAFNNLHGVVPPSIYNLSSIEFFSLGFNTRIKGYLPSDLGHLFPQLKMIEVQFNQFVGEIPVSLTNASQLESIFLGENNFVGKVPRSFGTLKNLRHLYLTSNNLGTGGPNDLDFLASLANCTKLQAIVLLSNQFGGSLPKEIANLSSHMTVFSVELNQVSGTIPSGIGNLINLVLLEMSFNQLIGPIPTSIGQLQQLQILLLDSNRLTGEVPSSIGNITWLTKLYLCYNRLHGTIPSSIQNCKNLLVLDLSMNNLNGSLSKEVFDIPSLSISLNISHNHFTGPLPSYIENMKALGELDVSWNKNTSEIPASLGKCISLERLFMQHNSFEGSIPLSFSSLMGIQFLDLSHNNLTGLIPRYVDRFKLLYLNLSFNSSEGEIPTKGIFRNYSVISVSGNDRLCGGIPELLLPTCPMKSHRFSFLHLFSIIVGSCIFLGLAAVFLWFQKKKSDHEFVASLSQSHPQIAYEQIQRATGGFSPSNLIGVGSFGSVYKGTIGENEHLIAVKVLNLQQQGASRSFTAECEALRNIRHRNLVRIITSCSSIDFQGNEFKALVYEYMPNGSLEKWLHPLHQETNLVNGNLSLRIRLNIAIDVACALDYLHHGSQEPIIHCDLKPSNVLLDKKMTGHVGDFGLAKILGEEVMNPNESSSIGVKGTIGYAAPAYGLGVEVSRAGDVYSFGILLLEMITGKRPTDSAFENGWNLHKFGRKAVYDENVMEIVDPSIVRDHKNDGTNQISRTSRSNVRRIEECVRRMVEIGVACSMDSPADRMDMSLVVRKLSKARDAFEKTKAKSHNRIYTENVVA